MPYHTRFFDLLDKLNTDDKTLTRIITLHVFTEREINDIIKENCKNPKRPVGWSSFNSKIELIHAIGVIKDSLFHNLVQLNKIRNKLAHGTVKIREINDLVLKDYYDNPINLKTISSDDYMLEMLIGQTFERIATGDKQPTPSKIKHKDIENGDHNEPPF
jgi:DNA-binding MltR family transcriptional regulator